MRRVMTERLLLVCSIELLAVRVRRWCTLTASWPKWCAVVYTNSGVQQQQWCTVFTVQQEVQSKLAQGNAFLDLQTDPPPAKTPLQNISNQLQTENPENSHLIHLA